MGLGKEFPSTPSGSCSGYVKTSREVADAGSLSTDARDSKIGKATDDTWFVAAVDLPSKLDRHPVFGVAGSNVASNADSGATAPPNSDFDCFVKGVFGSDSGYGKVTAGVNVAGTGFERPMPGFHLGIAPQSTVRSDLSLASVFNTSRWSPFQMGHSCHTVGGYCADSGRRAHGGEDYAARFLFLVPLCLALMQASRFTNSWFMMYMV